MRLTFRGAIAAECLFLVLGSATAADLPDFAKVDRTLRKEPSYNAKQPLFGLAVFGPKADKSVWLVLDKSAPEEPHYDVLYLDLTADGDLTAPGKRFVCDTKGERFSIGDFVDPATSAKHTDFTVRLDDKAGPSVMLSLRWRGEYKFGGGYPEDPEAGYLTFAASKEQAPIVWLYGNGPFRFQRWYGNRLTIGGETDFKVFLGQPGRGRSAFCAAQQHFLPEGEIVRATVIYRDGMGKEQQYVCDLKERC